MEVFSFFAICGAIVYFYFKSLKFRSSDIDGTTRHLGGNNSSEKLDKNSKLGKVISKGNILPQNKASSHLVKDVEFRFNVAGVSFENTDGVSRQDILRDITTDTEVWLDREDRDEKYHGVRVFSSLGQIGYLPAPIAAAIKDEAVSTYFCSIESLGKAKNGLLGVRMSVRPALPVKSSFLSVTEHEGTCYIEFCARKLELVSPRDLPDSTLVTFSNTGAEVKTNEGFRGHISRELSMHIDEPNIRCRFKRVEVLGDADSEGLWKIIRFVLSIPVKKSSLLETCVLEANSEFTLIDPVLVQPTLDAHKKSAFTHLKVHARNGHCYDFVNDKVDKDAYNIYPVSVSFIEMNTYEWENRWREIDLLCGFHAYVVSRSLINDQLACLPVMKSRNLQPHPSSPSYYQDDLESIDYEYVDDPWEGFGTDDYSGPYESVYDRELDEWEIVDRDETPVMDRGRFY